MALEPGTRLGVYEIIGLLGSGGMGEVWRARDVKLQRDVAIKVLPQALHDDPERLARFEREAKTLAALSHPNVAHVYGFEDSASAPALVMELVEGPTLADRIAKGPIPLDEALSIAKQIAEGLEAAHEQGIIHRDLKPANIKVRDDGAVKVLDFGLAKTLEPTQASSISATQSPTITTPAMMTGVGVILGTAAYMSPEQAKGRPADKRSDIWAFGSVLFEMLTGKRAFDGDDVGDTLAAILRSEPEWRWLPADTPVSVCALLRRCLTKDRMRRLQAAGEARIAIDDALTLPAGTGADATPLPQQSRSASAAGWVAAAVMTMVAAMAAWNLFRAPARQTPPVVRFSMRLPLARNNGVVLPGSLALSRDGSRVAFVGGPRQELYVRSMDQFDARTIPGTEGASFPQFSPDGSAVVFIGGNGPTAHVKRVQVSGGPVQNLAEAASTLGYATATWSLEDTILYTSNGALFSIPARGGNPKTVAAPDGRRGEQFFSAPELLPDNRHVLVTAYLQTRESGALSALAIDLQTGERKMLLDRAGITYFASTAPAGAYLAFYDGSTTSLMAAPFDWKRLEVTGTPVPVLERIQRSVTNAFGTLAMSSAGALIYVEGTPAAESQPVWVDRKGKEQPLAVPARFYTSGARLSPEGRRITFTIVDRTEDVWVADIDRGTLDRVSSEGTNGGAIWSPDGRDLIYERRPQAGAAVIRVPADRSGPATVLAAETAGPIVPASVTPDGRTLVGWYARAGKLWTLPLPPAPGVRPKLIFDSGAAKYNPALSPDGKWIAYRADETGRAQIYVSAFPNPGGQHLISTEGGSFPRWAASGRELFYRNGRQVMAVDVESATEFRAGTPKKLFEGDYLVAYDVHPDGQHLLMLKPVTASSGADNQVNVVLNWFTELQQRVPPR